MENDRKVQIFKNENWRDVEFESLKTGDKLRMFEIDGEEVKDKRKNTEFVATSNAFLSVEGVWSINVID